MGSNVIQFQFLDQSWNSLIKVHLLDPKNERIANTLFFDPHHDFKTFVLGGQGGDENLEMKHANCFHIYRA